MSNPTISETENAACFSRISEEDKNFCSIQQAAYEAALSSIRELQEICDKASKTQEDILADSERLRHSYFPLSNEANSITDNILRMFQRTHSIFIEEIVYYFNHSYLLGIDYRDILNRLMPQEPISSFYYEFAFDIKTLDQYSAELESLTLTYDTILDVIFEQMEGKNLKEWETFKLKTKCHSAAWNEGAQRYKLLNKHLCLFQNFCRPPKVNSCLWEISEDLRAVLLGIVHFESGSTSNIEDEIKALLKYPVFSSEITFSKYKNIQQLCLLPNGHAEIRFSSADLAQKFVQEYLEA